MTDQKKTVIYLIVFYLLAPSLALADWKTDINQYLKEEKWEEAQILLENSLPSLAEPDRQEAWPFFLIFIIGWGRPKRKNRLLLIILKNIIWPNHYLNF